MTRVEHDEKASTLAAATDMIGGSVSVVPMGAVNKGHFQEAAPEAARPAVRERREKVKPQPAIPAMLKAPEKSEDEDEDPQ
jgi:hypothetical protein